MDQLSQLVSTIKELQDRIVALETGIRLADRHHFVPTPLVASVPVGQPFMPYSTCSASDFLHPRYVEICNLMKHPFVWQRKLWEWVFVIHHLLESGAIRSGSRGLVFGVGSERLPAVFASLGASIVATDAPIEIGINVGWQKTGEHISSTDLIRYPDIISGDLFDERVSYQTCDMNNIDPTLRDFDFNWSSCCFEHLGTLDAGMQFVVNAVEKTLKIGGVAVHTTEFNLSSNDETIESGATVIYRRRDMERLVKLLRSRGHSVEEFTIAPNSSYWDYYIDLPPYVSNKPHLKMMLEQFVSTSVGIVVRRGV